MTTSKINSYDKNNNSEDTEQLYTRITHFFAVGTAKDVKSPFETLYGRCMEYVSSKRLIFLSLLFLNFGAVD